MKKIIIVFFLILIIFMALQSWDGLQKNATDPETIEEAINRLIAVHEADSSAHLGEGESLQSHKNDPIIDHPAESIIPDKISSSDSFLHVPVYPLDTGNLDNCSGIETALFAGISQNSSFSDEGYYFIAGFIPSDLGYSGGDVIFDFMIMGSGASGSWQGELSFSFGKVQIKQGYYRVGYYSSGWSFSSWTALSVSAPLRFRFEYSSSENMLYIYLKGTQIYSHEHSFDLEDDEFNIRSAIDRGSSSTANVSVGNLLVYFDNI